MPLGWLLRRADAPSLVRSYLPHVPGHICKELLTENTAYTAALLQPTTKLLRFSPRNSQTDRTTYHIPSVPGMEARTQHTSPGKPRGKFTAVAAAMLTVLLPLSTAFITWKGLSLLTNSPVPVVCVVSESMAPTFNRGDLLLLWNWPESAEPGDIPVVWFDGNPLPMVHRIVVVFHDTSDGYFRHK